MGTRERHLRLARLQAAYGMAAWNDVSDATGVDSRGRLRVVIDATVRFVDVHVLDIGRLRQPSDLNVAVREAWQRADLVRLSRSLEASGALGEWQELGRERLNGRLRLDPVGQRAHRAPVGRGALPSTTATSGNGFVTIRRTGAGDISLLSVDETWLHRARPDHLERALLEAANGTPKGRST